MNTCIEPAVPDDIDSLVVLLCTLFSIEQDFVPDAAAQRRGLEMLIANPKRGRVFVARHAGQGVVGMVSAQLVISTAIGAPSVWIEDMVVRETFRGMGVGKALLDSARGWAIMNGAGRIQLLVDADNTPALEFYRHLDWQPTQLVAWKKLLS